MMMANPPHQAVSQQAVPHRAAPAAAAGAPDPAAVAELHRGSQVLVASIPTGWEAQPHQDVLRLLPPGHASLRNPPVMELLLHPEASAPGPWPGQRDLEGRPAHFRLVQAEGGSGGDAFELTAWMRCGTGHVVLHYSVQSEAPVQPDLEPAWSVLGGATCRSAP